MRRLGLLVTLLILGLCYLSASYAMSNTREVRRVKKPVVEKLISREDPNYDFQNCPYPEALKKQGQFWQADGEWKSFSESFVDKIDHFLGAQWQGVQVGRIICVYAGTNEQAFPVSIQRGNLVDTPRIEGWKRKEYNVYLCHSRDVKQCPYLFSGQSKEATSEEELRKVFREIKQ